MITQQVVLVLRNFAQTQMHSVERYGTAIGLFFFCFVLSCESKTRSCGCVRESNAETCREIENMMLTDFIFIFSLIQTRSRNHIMQIHTLQDKVGGPHRRGYKWNRLQDSSSFMEKKEEIYIKITMQGLLTYIISI
jgi:hypothetical protein